MITRLLLDQLIKDLNTRDITILNGPRRIGKTTLVQDLIAHVRDNWNTAYIDFTDPRTYEIWQDFSIDKISLILKELGLQKNKSLLVFDEIQYLDNVGILLKLFYDHFLGIKVVATGSSSFLLLQHIGDSLAGRKKMYTLYPLSFAEIEGEYTRLYWQFKPQIVSKERLQETMYSLLLYGSYPSIFLLQKAENKKEKLKEIADSYLFKDLLSFEQVKNPRVLTELTRLLAYQIGSLVNPNEIASTLGIARETVLNYIDLLEKFFVIFRVYPYEKNKRDIIKKQFKVYFFDLGIRNAIIGNFSPLQTREDRGPLLENAVALGLTRRIVYDRTMHRLFFWRNYDGKEVDLMIHDEEKNKIIAREVKWHTTTHGVSKAFENFFSDMERDARTIDTEEAYVYYY